MLCCPYAAAFWLVWTLPVACKVVSKPMQHRLSSCVRLWGLVQHFCACFPTAGIRPALPGACCACNVTEINPTLGQYGGQLQKRRPTEHQQGVLHNLDEGLARPSASLPRLVFIRVVSLITRSLSPRRLAHKHGSASSCARFHIAEGIFRRRIFGRCYMRREQP